MSLVALGVPEEHCILQPQVGFSLLACMICTLYAGLDGLHTELAG